MTQQNRNLVPPETNPKPPVSAVPSRAVPAPIPAPVRQATSTVEAAPVPQPAEVNPEPKDLNDVKDMLLTAVSTVTGQAKAELTAFAEAMAPTAAVCLVMSRAGDERATMTLKALKTTMLMTAAIYGVKLLQSSELAFLAAINVGFSMLLGPGGGALAGQAAAAVIGGVSDAVKTKAV